MKEKEEMRTTNNFFFSSPSRKLMQTQFSLTSGCHHRETAKVNLEHLLGISSLSSQSIPCECVCERENSSESNKSHGNSSERRKRRRRKVAALRVYLCQCKNP